MNAVNLFLAGLGTYLTPCVYPLIPIYLTSLLGADPSEEDFSRGKLMLRAMAFSLGFILIFSIMGLGAAGIGRLMASHKGWFQLIGGIFILLFGLKFLGWIQIPVFDRILRKDDSRSHEKVNVVAAFLMGVFFAAGWSPCIGPILGAVLTYTASETSSPATGFLYLSVYGLGFATPLLVMAFFAEHARLLVARTAKYLPVVEEFIGAIMIAVALTFFMGVVNPAPVYRSGADPTVPAGRPIVVEFMSSNCSICEKMEPVVNEMQTTCSGKDVEIRQVDISLPENRQFVKKYRILGVPTFVMIDERGREVARLVGEQPLSSLLQATSAMIGQECPGYAPIDRALRGHDDSQAPPPANPTPGHDGGTEKACPTSGEAPVCTE
ncbi:MAG: hypothetical protein CVU59_01740 [Deltaproteobacteria bacterium HGW-Deltaproteobacteria-17]|nr:MAG: hypothetical protein CVU59_01740 [Deltaproteobacteria bacterium HGW-Deltaproteobacteria-17]